MELLRGTAPKVRFYGPTPDATVTAVTVLVNGVESSVSAPAKNAGGNYWELQLPYLRDTANDVEITWDFTIGAIGGEFFDETFFYEVVSPLLTKQELQRILDDEDLADEDVWEVESAVRHVIQAYTGQKFGYDKGKTLTVEGHGETALRLPERLIAITGVNTMTSALDTRAFIITSDGWYLKKGWAEAVPLAATSDSTFWGESSFNNTIYTDPDDSVNPGYEDGGIIVAPGASGRATAWKQDYPFEITGDWGHKTIPTAVKEAAKLLVNDYACSETLYRDRYLESIKAADWRLQFSSRAWESTGNARADYLLSDYILMDWAVV